MSKEKYIKFYKSCGKYRILMVLSNYRKSFLVFKIQFKESKVSVMATAVINEELKAIMIEKGIKQADISYELNLPKSLVSKFFAGNTTTEFCNVLSIVKYIAPSDFERIMYNHCLALTKTSQVQCAFEYASNYRQDDLLRELFAAHSSDRKFADWIIVYELWLDVVTNRMEYDASLDTCRDIYGSLSSSDLKLKVDVIEAIAQYSLGHLDSVSNFIAKAITRLNELKDGFIKESLKSRLNLLHSYTLLYNKSNTVEAERLAQEVVKSSASPCRMVASAYYTIGHANMFKDTSKSLEYFDKAVRLFREIGELVIAEGILTNDIPFARNVSGEVFDASGACKEERAHQLIVRGDVEQAVELLGEAGTNYEKLYQGKAEKDVNKLIGVYSAFIKDGDNFFAQLAAKELAEFGINLQ
jgi:tetratricopeptide (TPR) repeat protein